MEPLPVSAPQSINLNVTIPLPPISVFELLTFPSFLFTQHKLSHLFDLGISTSQIPYETPQPSNPTHSDMHVNEPIVDSYIESDIEILAFPYRTPQPYFDQKPFQTNICPTPLDDLLTQFEDELLEDSLLSLKLVLLR